MPVPIQISCWNINGFRSTIIGDKLSDKSFLEAVKNDDVIALVETHNTDKNDTLSIPGYKRIKVKNRPKTNKSNKNGGGLAYFAKPNISKYVTPINNTNQDTIWIKIKKDILDKQHDTYVGTVYLPPHKNNSDSSKKILELFEEISNFQRKGRVIVQGDFNARTNVISDTVSADRYDPSFIENSDMNIPPRNSEDMAPADHRGKEFIELCKSLGLAMLNGRKIGDLFGKYTSLQWNGSSVVDYVVVDQFIFSSISYFEVGCFIPWLSDHCATRFQLKSNLIKDHQSDSQGGETIDALFWDADSPEKFIGLLRTHEQEISETLTTSSEINVLEKFQNLIKAVIEEGNFKKGKKKGSNDAPWFDADCRQSKKEISEAGKNVQRTPKDLSLRKILGEKKKHFRSLVKRKKRLHAQNVFENMLEFDRLKESKKFWDSLRSLNNEKEPDYISCISPQSWVDHFKKVRTADTDPSYPPDDTSEGPLDYEISDEELDDASGVLKNGKKCGIDLISYEILKCIRDFSPKLLLKVLNFVLQNNATAYEWFISIIAPIHKKGPKMDPDNYRGISLISCLYKLLTAILNKRIAAYCLENNILSRAQLGFVMGNRCSDGHFILHNAIKDYCHHNGKWLYSCFVDFSKAFDCIPRDILFERLKSKGITGKVFNLIKKIYTNEKCRIKMGNVLSDIFDANQGVRQGCILSPILFNIFISDLPEILNSQKNNPAKVGSNEILSCILWADDLVMLSESKEGLTEMLNDLSDFSSKNGLKINADKTKCMVFNKTGRHIRCNIKVDNMTITSVREYKYLGFLVTPSGEVSTGISDLKSRALYALVQLRKKLGVSFRENIRISFYLFDTLIKPIILYCSDFWGPLCIDKKAPSEMLPKRNVIDLVHMKFLKQLLGVQTQTSNVGVLLETGRVPLLTYAIKNSIKNWFRIDILNECNTLTKLSFQNIANNDFEWYKNIKKILQNTGLGNILMGDTTKPEDEVFKRLVDIFHQNAFGEISKESSKLRTYALLKMEAGEEPYLKAVKNIKDRMSMTKFRLSNHQLMIEKGRHSNIKKEDRICPFCSAFEDEKHFLLYCSIYSNLRETMLVTAEEKLNQQLMRHEDETMLKYLLGNTEISPTVAKYLRKTMELRNFLIDRPKQLN